MRRRSHWGWGYEDEWPSADELRAWAHDRLARFKVPKEIELTDGLPRTASGKLLRRELA